MLLIAAAEEAAEEAEEEAEEEVITRYIGRVHANDYIKKKNRGTLLHLIDLNDKSFDRSNVAIISRNSSV